jgi:hypothetical protein
MEIILVLVWIVCGIAAGVIASGRNADGCLWFGLGILLGPIALALAFMAGPGRECPKCRSNIPKDATRCPKCQADLAGSAEPPQPQYRCPKCHHPVQLDMPKCPGCGVLFAAGIPSTKKRPDCAEEVKLDARKCRFCGFRFDAEKEPPTPPPL